MKRFIGGRMVDVPDRAGKHQGSYAPGRNTTAIAQMQGGNQILQPGLGSDNVAVTFIPAYTRGKGH